MTYLEVIQTVAIVVLAGFLKYKTSKDKNKKEIKLAEINKISDDYNELKKRVEEAERGRDEAKRKAQEVLNKLRTLQEAFLVISPYIKTAMESTPESREAYQNFQHLINEGN